MTSLFKSMALIKQIHVCHKLCYNVLILCKMQYNGTYYLHKINDYRVEAIYGMLLVFTIYVANDDVALIKVRLIYNI